MTRGGRVYSIYKDFIGDKLFFGLDHLLFFCFFHIYIKLFCFPTFYGTLLIPLFFSFRVFYLFWIP